MFRHERPQKGRYRQFHQFGVEALGFAGPDVDVEQIADVLAAVAAPGHRATSSCTSIRSASAEARARYRDRLVAYLEQHRDKLDADSQRRLNTNPLRVLDSKNPRCSRSSRARRA